MRLIGAMRGTEETNADNLAIYREHAKLLTKGDNNPADDTELCTLPGIFKGKWGSIGADK